MAKKGMLVRKRIPPFRGSDLGFPNFPGQQHGASIEQVREFNKNMVRRLGKRLSGGTSQVTTQINLSGTAKFLLGLAFLNEFGALVTLTINNEVVFSNVDAGFFTLGKTEQDYYAVNRPLSGQDDVQITIQGDAAYTNQPIVFYFL
jgi:hypothetical protein